MKPTMPPASTPTSIAAGGLQRPAAQLLHDRLERELIVARFARAQVWRSTASIGGGGSEGSMRA